ncbi:hypothetical protein E4P42_08950 [Mycobacterium sp. PS03-16]|uniref:Rv0340 family IniB-related protein n=1 Tax=Mycobacterium sp. PS03-16 TaxID=2559611 RepID=UPI0010735DB0|nr:IniB N-terminal domain-containing protein [Mycobacterium sp. PS03-16]TFV59082.1 hypothetical protein E4P42_08950 [Mycobacterium sp. PS03-16]
MANSLLDFVMSLVRDPDAAARYAADPAGAIADAHLTDVTSADVNNLIPVVSESMSMAAPSSAGFDAFGAEAAGNVWASGAATAAFDAFDDLVPDTAVIDADVPVVVDAPEPVDSGVDALTSAEPVSLQFDAPLVEESTPVVAEPLDDWNVPVSAPQPVDHSAGFDLFD